MYVDPERNIYQKLGMKREEIFTDSGEDMTLKKPSMFRNGQYKRSVSDCVFLLAHPSPHVKSGMFMGQMKSVWRAMTSPLFDFQGDLHQQGGAIIAGPGKMSSNLYCFVSVLFFFLTISSLYRLSGSFLPL